MNALYVFITACNTCKHTDTFYNIMCQISILKQQSKHTRRYLEQLRPNTIITNKCAYKNAIFNTMFFLFGINVIHILVHSFCLSISYHIHLAIPKALCNPQRINTFETNPSYEFWDSQMGNDFPHFSIHCPFLIHVVSNLLHLNSKHDTVSTSYNYNWNKEGSQHHFLCIYRCTSLVYVL